MPPWAIQLLQAIVGVLLDDVIKDLPEIRSGLFAVNTPTATDAPVDLRLTESLDAELERAISNHEVPAP